MYLYLSVPIVTENIESIQGNHVIILTCADLVGVKRDRHPPPPLPKTSRSKTTDNLGLETPSGQILPRTPFLEKKFDPRIPNTWVCSYMRGGGGVDSTPNFEPILWRIRLFSSQSVECLLICHLLPKHVYHQQLIIAGTKQLPKHQLQTTQRIKTDNKLLDILSVRPRDKSLPSTTVNASHNHGQR